MAEAALMAKVMAKARAEAAARAVAGARGEWQWRWRLAMRMGVGKAEQCAECARFEIKSVIRRWQSQVRLDCASS